MSVFQVVPDAYAVSVTKGVYKQVEVYERDCLLYINHGSGFVRLVRGNYTKIATSAPNTYIDELTVNFDLWLTGTGSLCTEQHPKKHRTFL